MAVRIWTFFSAAGAMLALLPGCEQVTADEAAGAALERAAIASGTIRDPDAVDIAGLYGRDTDRLCIVGDRDRGYRIGASIDYGAREGCSARGSATRDGETLTVTFDGAPGCSFAASIDQDRIVFPGSVPDSCARLCSERSSLAAMEVDLLSEGSAEAGVLRDARGRLLCGR